MKSINQHIINSLFTAKQMLSKEAAELIKSFLASKLHETGGFIDRSGSADPYYTVFGYSLSYVFNLNINYKNHKAFLSKWQKENSIDFVHAVSLLRCHYLLEILNMKQKFKKSASLLNKYSFVQNFVAYQIARKIRKEHSDLMLIVTQYKSANEGFNHLDKNSVFPSVYANFLAYGLFEDLQFHKNWRNNIAKSCLELMLDDGSFVNHPKSKQGISSTTAAGLLLMHSCNYNIRSSATWLKTVIAPNGGFLAGKDVPVSDVLSTATSLLALNLVRKSNTEINTKATEFVNLHWDSSGGFFGSIADQIPDVEYTFYGLLTIGQNN